MKKVFLGFIIGFGLFFQSQLHAQNGTGEESTASSGQSMTSSPWYLGTGLGVDTPLQDWNPNFPLGGGGILFGGYRLNSLLSLQLDLNSWFFTGGGSSIYDYRTFCNLRFNFQSPAISTYLFAGPGYDVQVANPSGYSTSSLAGVLGLGFQFDIHPGEHLFLESRYNILFYRNLTQQDIPFLFGMSEDL
jgi:hypothetical protein